MNVELKDSLPYRIFLQDGQTLCRWLEIDDTNFTEPFFDETISRYQQNENNSKRIKCVSDLSVLKEWSGDIESIKPAAFIFHISRCGSTLLSQLLSLSDENIVLSEVPFFDELLRWGYDGLLKPAIRFYGAKRNKSQCRLFIKTDSWHILFYKQIRNLYPNVPFILLYGKPEEVLRSQQKQRGMQAVPGIIEPKFFGFDEEKIKHLSLDQYMVNVLEKYFNSFLETVKSDPLAFPMNYHDGAMANIEKLANIVSMPVDGSCKNEMIKRAGYHAKYPDKVFDEERVGSALSVDCTLVNSLFESLQRFHLHNVPV